MATSDPEFEEFWRDNVLTFVGKTIKTISRETWTASRKKPKPPTTGLTTGAGPMGLPARDETT